MKQGDALWKAKRAACASTCSEYSRAMGLGPGSRKAYLMQKLGLKAGPDDNYFMQFGREKEPLVAELYWRHTGCCTTLDVDAFATDPADSRFGGSVDRLVTAPEGHRILLECKTTGKNVCEVPIHHRIQMIGLAHLYGLHCAHYARYHRDTHQLFVVQLDWEQYLFENVILPKLQEFATFFEDQTLPPPTRKLEALELYKRIMNATTVRRIVPGTLQCESTPFTDAPQEPDSDDE